MGLAERNPPAGDVLGSDMPTVYWPAIRNGNPPKQLSHRVADIRFNEPRRVVCTCGWRADAPSSSEVERLWRLHKKEALGDVR